MEESNYYVVNKERMVKSIRGQVQSLKSVLKKYYEDSIVDDIINQVYVEFEQLLPKMPYIGGMDNLLTKQIVGSSPYLALYKALKRKEMPTDNIGKVIYDSSVLYWNSYPKILGPLMRWYFTSKGYFKKTLYAGAVEYQKRKYNGDFVYSAVDGSGKDFDYGIDYTECAICKFFHEQNADEITPYICLNDFVESDVFKMGLVRTTTIAEGKEKCDFRFHKGRIINRDLSRYFETEE